VKRRHLTELPSIILLQRAEIHVFAAFYCQRSFSCCLQGHCLFHSIPMDNLMILHKNSLKNARAAWDKARKVQPTRANTGKGMPRMNCRVSEAKLDSSLIPL